MKCCTGIAGLDDILGGELPRNRLYLVEGNPGVGKTTLALQFLLEGLKQGERVLYVTLSETKDELEAVAKSHGWTLDKIEIIDLSAVDRVTSSTTQNTLFHPAEVELNHLTQLLLEEVKRIEPTRVVLDSLSEMRLLAQNPLKYRRQVLMFKQYFSKLNCTVLMLDDMTAADHDTQVQSIVHGIVTMTNMPLKFGVYRRYITVTKLRGRKFKEGNHDYTIERGGLAVYPRLVAAEHTAPLTKEMFSSGNKELDTLLGGGLHAGTSNLFMGPAGSGKSTVCSMFAYQSAKRGQHVLYYAFDESTNTLRARSKEMGMDFAPLESEGKVIIEQIDPAQTSPGEFASTIIANIEKHKSRMVIIDSLNGYVSAMPGEEFLSLHMHELLTYLGQQNVVTIMIMAQHGLLGSIGSPADVSYIADTVVLLRFFEAVGDVKKAISIIKKRSGSHETTIREMVMAGNKISFGDPLKQFQGVLSGIPNFANINAKN
jgi:circadian clock protein KaiC